MFVRSLLIVLVNREFEIFESYMAIREELLMWLSFSLLLDDFLFLFFKYLSRAFP